jgi:hypothetical protein
MCGLMEYFVAKKNTKKDIVLGAVGGYQWEQIDVWALSLAKSGFQGIGAVIVYDNNETVIRNLKQIGFQVITMPLRAHVFNQRFFDFSEVLTPALSDLRYAIVTDVRDVYFQSDPTVWLEANLKKGKKFLAVSEGIRFKDESWNANNVTSGFPALKHRVWEEPVYNVGVLAGEATSVADLCLAVGTIAKSSGFVPADQSGYNILLGMEPYKSVAQICASEDGFACQAGTFADPNKIEGFRPNLMEPEPVLDGQDVKTAGGLIYPVVHQYDRVPAWNHALRVKLNDKLRPPA